MIVNHAFDYDLVEPVTSPSAIGTNRFKYQKWLSQLLGPMNGSLEAEIESPSSVGNHPVENEISLRVDLIRRNRTNSNIRYLTHDR